MHTWDAAAAKKNGLVMRDGEMRALLAGDIGLGVLGARCSDLGKEGIGPFNKLNTELHE